MGGSGLGRWRIGALKEERAWLTTDAHGRTPTNTDEIRLGSARCLVQCARSIPEPVSPAIPTTFKSTSRPYSTRNDAKLRGIFGIFQNNHHRLGIAEKWKNGDPNGI